MTKPLAYLLLTVSVVFVVALALLGKAIPADYSGPSDSDYYATLMMPDQPDTSCCGVADAYYADKTDACNPAIWNEKDDCALVAIITDTRPDNAPYYTNGKRTHIPVGSRIPIPKEKIRKHPIPNPTGHNIVFVAGQGNTAWCWEPLAGL